MFELINISTILLTHNYCSKDPLSYLNSFHSSLCFTPNNKFEILKIINNLKTCRKKHNTPGYDDIYPKIIKQISTFIAMPICHIIKCSMVTGAVPSTFKVAKVVHI